MNFLRSFATGAVLLAASCSPSKNDFAKEIKGKVATLASSGEPNSSGVIVVKKNGYTLQILPNGSWSIGHMPASNPFSQETVVSETMYDVNGDGIADKRTSINLNETPALKEEDVSNDSDAQKEALNFLQKMEATTGTKPEKREEIGETPTARWVKGAEGHLVISPFSSSGLVDVDGIEAGSKVKCPMTGKVFIVPQMPTEQKLEHSLKLYTEMFEGVEDPVEKQLKKLRKEGK